MVGDMAKRLEKPWPAPCAGRNMARFARAREEKEERSKAASKPLPLDFLKRGKRVRRCLARRPPSQIVGGPRLGLIIALHRNLKPSGFPVPPAATCILPGRFLGSPTKKFCTVTKSSAGEVIELHFGNQFGLERLPFHRSFGAPAAETSGCFSCEARWLDYFLQLFCQCRAVFGLKRRSESNMVEFALVRYTDREARNLRPVSFQDSENLQPRNRRRWAA